jgi:predicted permease
MIVTPGYLTAMGVPLVQGRGFDERDTATSLPVTLVDRQLAARFWPGEDPVGRRLMIPDSADDLVHPGPKARYVTVVGVVGDVKQRGLASHEERLGAYYFPFTQQPERGLTLVVRTAGDPTALVSSLRRAVGAVDAGLPLYDVQTMSARIAQSVAERRVAMGLAAGFAVIALLLATVGIYGVLAYQVLQRRREIGIRMALGSEARQVFGLVLKEGAALLAVGLVLGVGGLLAVRGALAAQLFGVTAFDPQVLGGVTALLALVGLVASALPARRAAATDPAVALTD